MQFKARCCASGATGVGGCGAWRGAVHAGKARSSRSASRSSHVLLRRRTCFMSDGACKGYREAGRILLSRMSHQPLRRPLITAAVFAGRCNPSPVAPASSLERLCTGRLQHQTMSPQQFNKQQITRLNCNNNTPSSVLALCAQNQSSARCCRPRAATRSRLQTARLRAMHTQIIKPALCGQWVQF
jgi:hypothetical protein